MSTASVISLSDLTFSYDGAEGFTLRGVWLEIPEGTVTVIMGPNGSGKTTLLRLLLGVLCPQAGTIRLAGRLQESYSRRERSQLVGLVPQDEHIPFDFSVLDYVLLGRAPYLHPLQMPGDDDRQVALAALQTTGLTHLRDRLLPRLSSGERQLALLARALAQEPHILFMDEPTAHLDLSNQMRLLEIVRALVAQGTTLVMTTHDPNLATLIAGYVVLMREGQLLDAGPAAAMLTSDKLSTVYDVPVTVRQFEDRSVVLLS
jgi:iron complex transport system ATP-binding protein